MIYVICIAVTLAVAMEFNASALEALLSGVAVWLLWRVAELQGELRRLRVALDRADTRPAGLSIEAAAPGGAPVQTAATMAATVLTAAGTPSSEGPRSDEHYAAKDAQPAEGFHTASPEGSQSADGSQPTDSSPFVEAPHSAASTGAAEPSHQLDHRTPARRALPLHWAMRALSWLRGGNPAVRLGIVVLFFGVAFLLKFAAERSLLPIELRLAAVAAGGAALLTFGWHWRRRAGYGLVLQGGGIGVLYLTIFAALRLYELLPAGLAFPLLVALTAGAGVLAVLQNAMALALLATAAGFLAPVLTATGSGSHIALFSYYALLNAGIFGISWFRAWRALNLVGFFFTFVIGSAWGIANYRRELFLSAECFLVLFFLFYLAISILFARRRPATRTGDRQGYVDGTLVFGLPIVVFGLQAALVQPFEHGLALSAVALGALYLGLARLLWRRHAELRLLTEALLALGVVFTTLAMPLAFDGRWTAAAWGLEGAALVWIGVRQQRLAARLFGLLLQAGAGIALLAAVPASNALPLLNGAFLGGLAQAVAGLFAAWYLQRHRKQLRSWERELRLLPFLWGAAWWYGSAIREIELSFGHHQLIAGTLLWCAATAVAATMLRPRLRFPQLQWLTQALLPALAAAVVLTSTLKNPIVDGGWLAFPLAFVALYGTLRCEERFDPIGWGRPWHAVSLWTLTAWLCALAATGIDALAPTGSWPALAWAALPALLLVSLGQPGRWTQQWPLDRHLTLYQGTASGGLAAALAVWLLALNLGSSGDPAPLPYLPLLTPVDLGSLLALLALGGLLLRHRQWPAGWRLQAGAALAGLGFLWLNALLARSVHHWLSVPLTFDALFASTELQAAVALLWSTLALAAMSLARRNGWRQSWYVGAGLVVAVLLKLFLVDLSGSGTVARIVAFLGVGVLLLVIGYLTPLAPAPRRSTLSS